MNYRRLGDAGLKLSEIGLGGWLTFGNAIDVEVARGVMNKAFDLGVNFYDTADVYAQGKCEEVWGQLLKDRRRGEYVLASKCFFPTGPGPNDRGLSRKHIMESCDASLRRLRTEYLDIYQCHRFDPETPLEETIGAMDDMIRRGKVIYWGFSEWQEEQISKCLQICAEAGLEKPKSSQPQYNMLQRYIEPQIFPLCHKAGIGQVVFSPLAQGVLTGKYWPGQQFPADSRAADSRQNLFIKKWTDDKELLAKVQKVEGVAREANCTMAQLALAWVLRRPEITSCITGASKPRQVEENVEASGIKLDEGMVRRIEEILA
ncbi:MAG TPA: aldo/keto reductase family protein [Tepidisphaeraceae bacterium]|jgi:voltage-dependent potassium channel beta subunit|nr:aldo/keto reductase family protein [Tepidisphaeraceae bacterium]